MTAAGVIPSTRIKRAYGFTRDDIAAIVSGAHRAVELKPVGEGSLRPTQRSQARRAS